MALRSGHGTGAGVPRVEVLPPDELPVGVPSAEEHAPSTAERTRDGRWTKAASTAQRAGGKSRRGKSRLATRLGLATLAADAAFAAYRKGAADFRRSHCHTLAHTVGGGTCSAGPSSIVASAAWQLAASRYLFDLAGASGDPDLFTQASRLADASRQNLLAAHELCAREAAARPHALVDHGARLAALAPKGTGQ